MYPVNTVDGIDQFLFNRDSQLIGILFAHKNLKLAREEILPMLPSYHSRSSEFIHFFLPGYLSEEELENYRNEYPDAEELDILVGTDRWFFSEKAFDGVCRTLKKQSKWKWSGLNELLLLDARQNMEGIDLSSVINVNLDRERENKRIEHLSAFFQKIFEYADENCGQTSCYDFSDSQIPSIVGSLARKVAEKRLPAEVSSSIKNLQTYAVRNFIR